MDLFKKKTKVKCAITFTLQAGNYIVATKPVYVQWKRGGSKDQCGQSKKEFATSGGLVLWDETQNFTQMMELDPKTKKFEEKHMSFTVLEVVEKDKEKTLGKAIINLAEVASHGLDEVKELIIGKGKDKKGSLTIKWRTTWQTYNGKPVLSAEEIKGRPLTEVTRIEGTDVYYSSTAKQSDDKDDDASELASSKDLDLSEADGSEADSASTASRSGSFRGSIDLGRSDKSGEKKEHRRSASLLGLFSKDKEEKDDKKEKKEKKDKEDKKEKKEKEKKEKKEKEGSVIKQDVPKSGSIGEKDGAAVALAAAFGRTPSNTSLANPSEEKKADASRASSGAGAGGSQPDAATVAAAAFTRVPSKTVVTEPSPASTPPTLPNSTSSANLAPLPPAFTRTASKGTLAGDEPSDKSGRSKKEKKEHKEKKEKKERHERAQSTDLTSEVLKVKLMLTEAERQLADEKVKSAAREEELQKSRAAAEASAAELAAAKSELSRLQKAAGEAEALRAELKRAQVANQWYQAAEEEHKEQLAAKDAEIKSKSVVVPAVSTEEVESLRKSLQQSEAAKSEQAKELSRLQKCVADMEKAVAEVDVQNKVASSTVQSVQEKKKKKKTTKGEEMTQEKAQEAERNELEAERKELDTQRALLNDSKMELDSARHALEAEKKAIEEQKREAFDLENKRQSDFEVKIKTVEERELAICAKEKELADREAQVNEKANTSKGVVRLKDVADMATLRKQCESSEKSLADMKAECDRLQKELLVAKEELAAAREVEPKVIIADIEPDHEDNARVAALQEDNESLRRMLADAETAAKMASTFATSGSAAHAEKVRNLVWTARYDITRVGALSVPSAGVELAHCILETDFPSALPSQLFTAIAASTARSATDRLGLSFWLSAVCALSHLLQKEKLVVWDVVKQGLPPLPENDNNCQFEEPMKNRREIDPAVRLLLSTVYSRCLRGLFSSLEPLALAMFFPSASLGAAADDASLRRSTQAAVLGALSEQLKAMRDVVCPAHVMHELFVAVFGELDALLFNALLEGKSQCSASRAVSLKLGVAALDDWISANGLAAIWDRTRLQHISQASNLLMMDKSILLNEESARAAFPVLTGAHCVRLVELFVPDELAPDAVSMAVRNAMQSLKARSAKESGSWLASPLKKR